MRKICSFAASRLTAGLLLQVLCSAALLQFSLTGSADAAQDPDTGRSAIWRTVLDQMPLAWRRARRVEIRWVSDREMNRLVADQEDEDNQRGDDSTIQGFYDRAKDDRSPATITVRANLSRQETTFVLSHEFAHMVWDEVLTRRDRSEYRRIWEDQRHDRRLVSRYAAESPEEGFAEAVASYIWQNERLRRRDDLSFDFVHHLIRASEEARDDRSS